MLETGLVQQTLPIIQPHLSSFLVNNRVIVIGNRQKFFHLQLQLAYQLLKMFNYNYSKIV